MSRYKYLCAQNGIMRCLANAIMPAGALSTFPRTLAVILGLLPSSQAARVGPGNRHRRIVPTASYLSSLPMFFSSEPRFCALFIGGMGAWGGMRSFEQGTGRACMRCLAVFQPQLRLGLECDSWKLQLLGKGEGWDWMD